jgi:hypothetical protein
MRNAPGRESNAPAGIQTRTGVSQLRGSGADPRVSARKRSWTRTVTGPRDPGPTGRPSIVWMGVISATVPLKKASEAV